MKAKLKIRAGRLVFSGQFNFPLLLPSPSSSSPLPPAMKLRGQSANDSRRRKKYPEKLWGYKLQALVSPLNSKPSTAAAKWRPDTFTPLTQPFHKVDCSLNKMVARGSRSDYRFFCSSDTTWLKYCVQILDNCFCHRMCDVFLCFPTKEKPDGSTWICELPLKHTQILKLRTTFIVD